MKKMQKRKAHRILEVELSDTDREKVLLAALGRSYPAFDEYEDYIAWAEREVGALFPIQPLLCKMQSDASPPSLVVIRNTPAEPWLPATPRDGERSWSKKTHAAEAQLVGVMRRLSPNLFGYRAEKGSLVGDLVHIPDEWGSLTNRGGTALRWHNDDAHEGDGRRPWALGFKPLRGDAEKASGTGWADVRDIVELMHPENVAHARRPLFLVNAPLLHGRRKGTKPMPILTGPATLPVIRVALYGEQTVPTNRAAARVLEDVAEAADRVKHVIPSEPDVLALALNFHGLHCRLEFRGHERWVQKVMARLGPVRVGRSRGRIL